MKNPPHPGDFVRAQIIEPEALSVNAASAALQGVAAFGVKMDTLMRMQSAFDIARTRGREKEIQVPDFTRGPRSARRSQGDFGRRFLGQIRSRSRKQSPSDWSVRRMDACPSAAMRS